MLEAFWHHFWLPLGSFFASFSLSVFSIAFSHIFFRFLTWVAAPRGGSRLPKPFPNRSESDTSKTLLSCIRFSAIFFSLWNLNFWKLCIFPNENLDLPQNKSSENPSKLIFKWWTHRLPKRQIFQYTFSHVWASILGGYCPPSPPLWLSALSPNPFFHILHCKLRCTPRCPKIA